MNILSCGAGMQSTALALMSCEKKLVRDAQARKEKSLVGQMSLLPDDPYAGIYPEIPVYDLICFCDLGHEAPWVYDQVAFIAKACEKAGIRFKVLQTGLYEDYLKFGVERTVSVPFWTIGKDGKKAKLRRKCTIDKKIVAIQKYVRYEMLGYRFRQHLKKEDYQAHEMHIGFSAEEKRRQFDSYNDMFVNKFPLIAMGLERPDNYKYILETWGLATKASACGICPFHTNYYFQYLKQNHPETYNAVVVIDDILEKKQPESLIRSKVFISRARKRIRDLSPEECNDAELFAYGNEMVWNGF